MNKAERVERLKVDVDTRLTEVWGLYWRSRMPGVLEDNDLSVQFGDAIRAAYALGYRDALSEARKGRQGELARANGYTKEAV